MNTLQSRSPLNLFKGWNEEESGQMVLLVAGALIVILGFGALAIDLGFMTHTRRSAQNDADAIALAGVQELARRGLSSADRELNATLEADAWALKNDVTPGEILSYSFGTTCSGDTVANTITVRLRRTQRTFLARVLGIGIGDLNVCATARTGLARGGPGLLPIALLEKDPGIEDICFYDDGTGTAHDNFYYNPSDGANLSYAPGGEDEKCVIKIPRPGAGDTWANGNSGPVRVDEQSQVDPENYRPNCDPPAANSGANEYGKNIEHDSDCPYAPGDMIRSLPGAQTGQTCSSFDAREADSHANHNLQDVFLDPIYDSEGNPTYTRVDRDSPHFGILPVTTTPSGGTDWVEIVRFVTVYVVGCETTGNGSNALYTVTVIPVNSQYFSSGEDIVEPGDDDYDDDWPAYTIKLIE